MYNNDDNRNVIYKWFVKEYEKWWKIKKLESNVVEFVICRTLSRRISLTFLLSFFHQILNVMHKFMHFIYTYLCDSYVCMNFMYTSVLNDFIMNDRNFLYFIMMEVFRKTIVCFIFYILQVLIFCVIWIVNPRSSIPMDILFMLWKILFFNYLPTWLDEK